MEKQIIKTIKEFEDWVDKFEFMTPLALDTETTDLNWYKLNIVGFSLCDGKRACYVLWNDEIFNNISYSYNGGFLQNLINNCSELIMHNASFDLKVLEKIGIDYLKISNIFDTMIGSWLLNENDEHRLKHLAHKVLKIPKSEIKSFEEASQYGMVSPAFQEYAMNDAIWTYQLYEKEKYWLKKQGMEYLFYKIEMPFQKVLAEMAINGFLVDVDKAHKMQDFVEELLADKMIALCKSADISYTIQSLIDGRREVSPDINFNSSQQMVDLIESLGLEITEMTKPSKRFPKGQKSVGKETMQRLSGQHPFIDLLDEYKSLEKLHKSYLVPVDDFIDEDKRIRCDIHATGTVTGRVSASDPNLENLPNPLKTPLPVNYRDIFIAPKGKVLIVADYSGQELRGLTEVSRDPGLIEAFQKDKDIHLAVTNSCLNLGIPEEDLYKTSSQYKDIKTKFEQQRDQLKNGVVFPLIYGKTAWGMSKDMNISEDLAQKWIDGFLNLYPKVREEIDNTAKELKRFRYVKNKHGRRRRLNPAIAKSYRQAFNFLIQSLGAEQLKLAASSCQRLKWLQPKWDLKLLLPIHDELIFEVNEEYAEIAAKEIKKRMENCVDLIIPSFVDIKIVKCYGDAK